MKERPILMNAPMIRATLRDVDPKTQTRRAIKPQPTDQYFWEALSKLGRPNIKCPYGKPGDRLWVRETWANLNADFPTVPPYFIYRADGADHGPVTWKPSIHMPRAASRILLEITDVRVGRLNEISEADAQAEGAPCNLPVDDFIEICKSAPPGHVMKTGELGGHRLGFYGIWCQINGILSWDANPWVWVIEFKPLALQAAPKSEAPKTPEP
jgi:hypothetical protein